MVILCYKLFFVMNVVSIERGIDVAAARLNREFAPATLMLQGVWRGLQFAMEGMGTPVHTRRWEYQWPTVHETIDTLDDQGRVVRTMARASVWGELFHVPRTRAAGALSQLFRCQALHIPMLPAAKRQLWNVIHERTQSYTALVVPLHKGTRAMVLRADRPPDFDARAAYDVDDMGPQDAGEWRNYRMAETRNSIEELVDLVRIAPLPPKVS